MTSEQERLDQWKFESEMLIQQAKEEGQEYGFVIDKVTYSGFSSQGDGASWEGYIDIPKYISWKLDKGEGSECIKGIPNGILEAMFWMFSAGVFEYKIAVHRWQSHYYHDKTMDLAEFYWTFMGSNDTETMGQYGGPFADTTVKTLLQATQWSWEQDGHVVTPEQFGNADEPQEYYRTLWETMLSDARNFAVDIYQRLEKAYDELHDLRVDAE
jgi:hypothetical protein